MKELPAAFAARMKALLGEEEFRLYEASFAEPAVRAFRVNTEKISVADFAAIADFAAEPIPYVDTGYYLDCAHIGSHPFHHAGMIYVQDPGAMATAECLEIGKDWWILDLCAAPGGKSSQLRNKLGEEGILVANEIVPSRCRILTGNIERLGFRNTATTCLDPVRIARLFPETFDMIMVDAPCSGEGMFRKDETAIREWSPENVRHCAERQKGILAEAVKALRPGGYIVYATCTFSLEENEMVVDGFLQKHPEFELIPVREAIRSVTADGIAFEGCKCPNIRECRRFYPHRSRGEGQFMAVLHDTRPASPRPAQTTRPAAKTDPVITDFLRDTLADFDPTHITVYNGNPVYVTPALAPDKGTAFSCGVTVGEVRKNYIVPHHQFFMAMGKYFKRRIELAPDSPELERYLHGEELSVGCENGWAVITTAGCTVGGAKVTGGRAKNHYPKGLRK
ncbi:MAG: SAM-dependent methyltransferase [Clostridia bacterium]|nr:SAM-dependent methyltransferase [Clostridia bacterium]